MSKFHTGECVRIKKYEEIIPANTCECTSTDFYEHDHYFRINKNTVQVHAAKSDMYIIKERADYSGQEAYHVKLPGDRSRLWFNPNLYWAAEMLELIEQDDDEADICNITDEALIGFLTI